MDNILAIRERKTSIKNLMDNILAVFCVEYRFTGTGFWRRGRRGNPIPVESR